MTYENYKNGMLRVFVVLSIPLVLVTYFEYDLSLTNKFFYSLNDDKIDENKLDIYPVKSIIIIIYFFIIDKL